MYLQIKTTEDLKMKQFTNELYYYASPRMEWSSSDFYDSVEETEKAIEQMQERQIKQGLKPSPAIVIRKQFTKIFDSDGNFAGSFETNMKVK